LSYSRKTIFARGEKKCLGKEIGENGSPTGKKKKKKETPARALYMFGMGRGNYMASLAGGKSHTSDKFGREKKSPALSYGMTAVRHMKKMKKVRTRDRQEIGRGYFIL